MSRILVARHYGMDCRGAVLLPPKNIYTGEIMYQLAVKMTY